MASPLSPVLEEKLIKEPELHAQSVLQTDSARVIKTNSPARVALITSASSPVGPEDAQSLIEAAAKQNILLKPQIWDEPADWLSFDALLPLYVWDYSLKLNSFYSWLIEREEEGCLLYNSAEMIRRCIDKAYLLDLQDQGVPMARLLLRPAGSSSPGDWKGNPTLVVKPRWGCGGHELRLGPVKDWRVPHEDVLAQEYQPLVMEKGEISIICIAGRPVAAVRRYSDGLDFRVEAAWGGTAQAELLTEEAFEAVECVFSCLSQLPLYARLDFWEDKPWQLVEAKVFEPDLYFHLCPRVSIALAAALRYNLDNLWTKTKE
jgi:glutathione synthase/RimK-type ligase-like ATP-grasp enzyme